MLKLLISPLAQRAYFNELDDVVLAEVHAIFPLIDARVSSIGPLRFVDLSWDQESNLTDTQTTEDRSSTISGVNVELISSLMRLSFVQGICQSLTHQRPHDLSFLDILPQFKLPGALVWGSKYRGKTNELVTQLALNLALHYGEVNHASTPSLLDPMAGRGTTLLCAARYGLNAVGIEIDHRALDHFQRDTKRQTKLHKIKHKFRRGTIGSGKKSPRFLEFKWPESTCRLIQGDSRHAEELTQGQRFHYLVSDLPYGVQFGGVEGRNPLDLIIQCAPAWIKRLRTGGVMVIIFNSLQPRRHKLLTYLANFDLDLIHFSAPHRMSESIQRDLIVMRKL